MNQDKVTEYLLRIGVAFAFIYPPIAAWFAPYSWIGYFPPFISTLGVDELLMLHIFGIVELIVAIWILFGRNIALPSAVATLMLAGIVVFNLPQMDVLFRDIPIMVMAFALTYRHL